MVGRTYRPGRPARAEARPGDGTVRTSAAHRGLLLGAAFWSVAALVGCSTVTPPLEPVEPTPDASASPPPSATVHVDHGEVDPTETGTPIAPPTLEAPDPVLEGSWATRADVLDRQAWFEELWRGRGSGTFRRYLERMGAWEPMVAAELEARGLPESLRFLPIIESGYNPSAVSRAGAVGLWQLMSATARESGLTVTAVVDERRDPWRATPVALDFLALLHDRFQSWPLALSAYNSGPARVARLARTHAPGMEYGDSVYYRIRPHLPRETRDFIPKLMAAAALASAPEANGFADVVAMPPMTFDEVAVPDATSVDVLASAAEVDQSIVEALNPQLRRGFTPAGRETSVRVPAGTGARFAANYARIPPEDRITFLEHRVASGDTFWDIARAYGVSVELLRDANPRIRPDRLQIGQWVTVPRAPTATAARRTAPASSVGGGGGGGQQVHVVRRGDTLWDIARRYGVEVGAIRRWNGLAESSVIKPGDRLKVGQ